MAFGQKRDPMIVSLDQSRDDDIYLAIFPHTKRLAANMWVDRFSSSAFDIVNQQSDKATKQ